jgi:transketolase N-terminal domain/subunit
MARTLDDIRLLARQLRVDAIRCSTAAGSGHPTSSLSAADLMAVLMARHLRYDWERPDLPTNDHLVFSKGHASPLLSAMFRAGVIGEEELPSDASSVGGHGTMSSRTVRLADCTAIGRPLSCQTSSLIVSGPPGPNRPLPRSNCRPSLKAARTSAGIASLCRG